jgi:hypothetical protein
MKIVDKREKSKKGYTFADLYIGQHFLDRDGDLGIKTCDDEYLLVEADGKGDWDVAYAIPADEVKPLEVTLIIEREL